MALNIAFDIPQNPAFNVEKFRQQVIDYANMLIANVTPNTDETKREHRVLSYNELAPEVQSLIGICKDVVCEDDINGSKAREEYLKEKYADD